MGPIPVYMGYIPDETTWHSELKRIGHEPVEYPKSIGACFRTYLDDGSTVVWITLNRSHILNDSQLVGFIAHEAVHAVDFITKAMVEKEPSEEFRCYTTQYIVQEIYAEYKRLFG